MKTLLKFLKYRVHFLLTIYSPILPSAHGIGNIINLIINNMMNKKWKRHSLYWLFYAVYYVVINWWQNVAMSLWLVLLTVPYFAFVFIASIICWKGISGVEDTCWVPCFYCSFIRFREPWCLWSCMAVWIPMVSMNVTY